MPDVSKPPYVLQVVMPPKGTGRADVDKKAEEKAILCAYIAALQDCNPPLQQALYTLPVRGLTTNVLPLFERSKSDGLGAKLLLKLFDAANDVRDAQGWATPMGDITRCMDTYWDWCGESVKWAVSVKASQSD